MHGPPATEESHQIEALTQAVEELRRRVAALEQSSTGAGAAAATQIAPAALPPAELPNVSSGILSALGRVLLGIAGAYLLRAITEAGLVPQIAGTSLGLLYAAGWLLSSVRISIGRRLTVAMHGVTAACIVAPLLWEATVRFHSVPPAASASVLALFVILGQVFAWQRDHSELAGVTAFTGSATALTLVVATLNPLPFAVALTLVAAVVEFGAWHNHALSWRWIAALACDFCGFLLLYLVTRPQGLPEGYAPIPVAAVSVLLAALAVIYVTSTALRTLVHGTAMGWFEILQIALAAALAIGGGLRISHGAGPWALLIAATCLILGAACYLAAFTSLAAGRNFHAYATFALLLVLIGGALLPAGAALLWTGLALAAAAFSTSRPTETPAMHAAIYLIAAASASGLLIYAAGALTAGAAHRAGTLNAAALLSALAAPAVYGLVLRSRKLTSVGWPQRIPAALVAALLAWILAGLACGVLLRIPIEAAPASTVRTGVLSVFAVALAWFGSRKGWRELIWILFPWMLFGAIKLVAEDFQHGRSDTLFLSLLIYGGTLIALPRLLRRDSKPT
jgi:hypothetical protein